MPHGLDPDCKVCFKRMSSYDLKYNWQYGVCASCYVENLEGKESNLELQERKMFQRYPDTLDARDAFREYCQRYAKEIIKERQKRIKEMGG